MNETDLRWRLRQLPREMEPARDLWPDIAAAATRASAKRRWPWMHSLAMAASIALAFGLAWRIAPAPVMPMTTAAQPDEEARVLEREATAMTREYQAALREFDGAPVPGSLEPGLRVLDDSARQIRAAIAVNPDSPALLQQLRKTYSRRLALTQRALTS
ncbi:hypothetical protein [Arenimonas sp.]|uniref:hypothetical protein n=1 Tax=Arenimonas sp. TaxID=1872635 RepID=UPI0039E7169D